MLGLVGLRCLIVDDSPGFRQAARALLEQEGMTVVGVGLAVVGPGLFAVSGSRGFSGLQVGSLLAGFWLILSPFILDEKFAIASPMYWSNIFAGGLIAAVAWAALGETWWASSR
jgi:hypothetical protein